MSNDSGALSRRDLLSGAAMLAAAGLLPLSAEAAAGPVSRFSSDPFKLLGVASGDPWATGAVLWTRLALDLADAERWGLGDRS